MFTAICDRWARWHHRLTPLSHLTIVGKTFLDRQEPMSIPRKCVRKAFMSGFSTSEISLWEGEAPAEPNFRQIVRWAGWQVGEIWAH